MVTSLSNFSSLLRCFHCFIRSSPFTFIWWRDNLLHSRTQYIWYDTFKIPILSKNCKNVLYFSGLTAMEFHVIRKFYNQEVSIASNRSRMQSHYAN